MDAERIQKTHNELGEILNQESINVEKNEIHRNDFINKAKNFNQEIEKKILQDFHQDCQAVNECLFSKVDSTSIDNPQKS